MIHPATFAGEMRILQERFSRKDLTKETLARYYRYLTDRLTDAQFRHAAQVIFNTDTFWPSPARFIDAAHGGSIAELAERDWQRVMTLVRQGHPPDLAALPAAVRAGLSAAPYREIIAADEAYALPRHRAAFIAAYTRRASMERERPKPALDAPAGTPKNRALPTPEEPEE